MIKIKRKMNLEVNPWSSLWGENENPTFIFNDFVNVNTQHTRGEHYRPGPSQTWAGDELEQDSGPGFDDKWW